MKFSLRDPKILFRLLPLLLLIFLGIATFFTLTLTRRSQELRSKATGTPASLLLTSTTNPVVKNPGETFTVGISLNTNTNDVVGSDILLQFDKAKLTLQSITKPTSGTGTEIFKTYVPVTSDNTGTFDTTKVVTDANTNGVVEFGLVAFDWSANGGSGTLTGTFNGSMSPVATLTFQVKSGTSGSSAINFKFDSAGATTDTNVVINPAGGGDPQDILGQPASVITVTIGNSTAPTPTPTPTTSVLVNAIDTLGNPVNLQEVGYVDTDINPATNHNLKNCTKCSTYQRARSSPMITNYTHTGGYFRTWTRTLSSVTAVPPNTGQLINLGVSFTKAYVWENSSWNEGQRSITFVFDIPTTSPTPTPTPTPTPSSTPTATPDTSPNASPASLILKLKFEGVNSNNAGAKNIKLTIKKAGTVVLPQTTITMTPDAGGIYSNSSPFDTGLLPDTYDLYVKGPIHLSKKFSGAVLGSGTNTIDKSVNTEDRLRTGNITDDGVSLDKVDIFDHTKQITFFNCGHPNRTPPPFPSADPPITGCQFDGDLDYDGIIGIFDHTLKVGNFNYCGDEKKEANPAGCR